MVPPGVGTAQKYRLRLEDGAAQGGRRAVCDRLRLRLRLRLRHEHGVAEGGRRTRRDRLPPRVARPRSTAWTALPRAAPNPLGIREAARRAMPSGRDGVSAPRTCRRPPRAAPARAAASPTSRPTPAMRARPGVGPSAWRAAGTSPGMRAGRPPASRCTDGDGGVDQRSAARACSASVQHRSGETTTTPCGTPHSWSQPGPVHARRTVGTPCGCPGTAAVTACRRARECPPVGTSTGGGAGGRGGRGGWLEGNGGGREG